MLIGLGSSPVAYALALRVAASQVDWRRVIRSVDIRRIGAVSCVVDGCAGIETDCHILGLLYMPDGGLNVGDEAVMLYAAVTV